MAHKAATAYAHEAYFHLYFSKQAEEILPSEQHTQLQRPGEESSSTRWSVNSCEAAVKALERSENVSRDELLVSHSMPVYQGIFLSEFWRSSFGSFNP